MKYSYVYERKNEGVSMDDYKVRIYEGFFRTLVKEIAKEFTEKYPENSEDTIQSEIEYIQERLEDAGLAYLFKGIINKDTFYQLCFNRTEEGKDAYKRRQEYSDIIDFAPIREKHEGSDDIIWILQRTGAKYRRGDEQVKDRNSYRQFEQLLSQIGFTDREQELFYDSETAFCFNALTDNGDRLYSQKEQDIVSHNGCGAIGENAREKFLFLNALEKSNMQIMHEKLRNLIKLCYKTKDSKSIQKMDLQTAIKVADYLSDLVPVIDKNSNLKGEKQLQDDKMAVRFAVLKFFMKEESHIGESGNDPLKEILVKYYENQFFLKRLLDEVYDKDNFNDEQILVITEGYLDSLEKHFKYFKDRVIQYHKVCKEFQDSSDSIQIYRDMWEEVWNNSLENE